MKPKARILVIDDNPDMLQVNKLLLEMSGYDPVLVDESPKALDLLRHGTEFDLILLDVQLGEESGIDLLQQIHNEMPNILETTPAVFLTGRHRIDCPYAAGMISKATDTSEFIAQVASFLPTASADEPGRPETPRKVS